MKLSEIEYPLRLCVEMLHFACWSCKKTEELKGSEIKELLANFFTSDQIEKATNIMIGKDNQINSADCQHEWVSAVNEVIKNGEVCLKCKSIRW